MAGVREQVEGLDIGELSQRPFTKKSLDEFMAKSLALPLTMVSDGLGCFTVFAGQGAVHDRTVTGGGKDSVKLPQFKADVLARQLVLPFVAARGEVVERISKPPPPPSRGSGGWDRSAWDPGSDAARRPAAGG